VRPSLAASPTATLVVEGYKYPNHHNSKHPRFLSVTFNTRALAFTPRHNSKDQSVTPIILELNFFLSLALTKFGRYLSFFSSRYALFFFKVLARISLISCVSKPYKYFLWLLHHAEPHIYFLLCVFAWFP
jgi:hypothetical protein